MNLIWVLEATVHRAGGEREGPGSTPLLVILLISKPLTRVTQPGTIASQSPSGEPHFGRLGEVVRSWGPGATPRR